MVFLPGRDRVETGLRPGWDQVETGLIPGRDLVQTGLTPGWDQVETGLRPSWLRVCKGWVGLENEKLQTATNFNWFLELGRNWVGTGSGLGWLGRSYG